MLQSKTMPVRLAFAWLVLCLFALCLSAQGNYEIQVYGSETVEKDNTMVELHSNYTINGSNTAANGELPTNHVVHETIEITHGWTPWFETGFYFFNSIGSGGRTAHVGSHIRPRVAAPQSWNWPGQEGKPLQVRNEKLSANTILNIKGRTEGQTMIATKS